MNYLTQDTDYPFAVLKGYAGTGKTTVISKLLKEVITTLSDIGVAAPTHKAVKVLKKHAIEGVSYRTVHSLLGLKEIIDYESGDISYDEDPFSKTPPPITTLSALILDETSMLQDDLFNRLVPYMKDGLKVIFVGDPAQIPPVRDKKKRPGKTPQGPDAIPFLHGEAWKGLICELTEVRRQAEGNPILEFATAIRSNYKGGTFYPQQKIVEGRGIRLVEHASVEETAILTETFKSPEFQLDADHMKVIAWTNNVVNEYNNIVRGILYRHLGHIEGIVEGEKLVTSSPYVINARNIIPANEDLLVMDVYTVTEPFMWWDINSQAHEQEFKVYKLTCEIWMDGEPKTIYLPVIHESSKGAYTSLLSQFADIATKSFGPVRTSMWKQYYKLRDLLAKVKYNYAITAHKSQGSTYTNCLVMHWDISYNANIEERNRILYVAATRPTDRLYIEV